MSTDDFKTMLLALVRDLVKITGPIIVITIWLAWQYEKQMQLLNSLVSEIRVEQKTIRENNIALKTEIIRLINAIEQIYLYNPEIRKPQKQGNP
jgi:hypothetical protein